MKLLRTRAVKAFIVFPRLRITPNYNERFINNTFLCGGKLNEMNVNFVQTKVLILPAFFLTTFEPIKNGNQVRLTGHDMMAGKYHILTKYRTSKVFLI